MIRKAVVIAAAALLSIGATAQKTGNKPAPDAVRDAMKRATRYMYDKVSNQGGFLHSYAEDFSRVFGELEAYPSMVWVESPGTPAVGQLMLDAYHATGDEYYYDMALRSASVLIRGQLPCGGWNYKFDLAGPASEKRWFATIGANAWGAGEHNQYYGNATFDDDVTPGVTRFLMRLYLEKNDPSLKPALDKAIDLLYRAQYPCGGWPQRFPLMDSHPDRWGNPDYTPCVTFNDAATLHNIQLLLDAYLLLGDERALEPLMRGMNCVRTLQQGAPTAGWADQYDPVRFVPAKARDFEPASISSRLTADICLKLIEYYELTGNTNFLSGIPAALDFLRSVALSDEQCAKVGMNPGRSRIVCPRFSEPLTARPLYIHRRGNHINNGEYYVDQNPDNIIKHYASLVYINIAGLEREYNRALALRPADLVAGSPLYANAPYALPRLVTAQIASADPAAAASVVSSLDAQGRWIVALSNVKAPYIGPGNPADPKAEKYDDTLGSPYDTCTKPAGELRGIDTKTFIANMATLIAALGAK